MLETPANNHANNLKLDDKHKINYNKGPSLTDIYIKTLDKNLRPVVKNNKKENDTINPNENIINKTIGLYQNFIKKFEI